jgi:predicted transcriptional regulator
MEETSELETRKQIYQLIVGHPGLNLSTIAELLHLSVPLVDYHTHHLEEDGLIIIEKEEGFKRYYTKGEIGVEDKKLLRILRQETPLKIVLFLLKNPNSKHKEILKHFDIAASTLSYHLNKLVKYGVIRVQQSGEEKGYIVVDEKLVMNFLIRYKPSDVLRRFKETWADDFQIP